MVSVLSPDIRRPPTIRKGTLHKQTHTHSHMYHDVQTAFSCLRFYSHNSTFLFYAELQSRYIIKVFLSFHRRVLRSLVVLTYPQPKIMNTPGLSLSRSSLLVRARQRGIKPEKKNTQNIDIQELECESVHNKHN